MFEASSHAPAGLPLLLGPIKRSRRQLDCLVEEPVYIPQCIRESFLMRKEVVRVMGLIVLGLMTFLAACQTGGTTGSRPEITDPNTAFSQSGASQTPLTDPPAVFHLVKAAFFKALTQATKVADDDQGLIVVLGYHPEQSKCLVIGSTPSSAPDPAGVIQTAIALAAARFNGRSPENCPFPPPPPRRPPEVYVKCLTKMLPNL
jgi:hypothetical protein